MEKQQNSAYEEIVEQIKEVIGSDLKSAFNYLNKHSKYTPNIAEFVSFFKFMNTTKKTTDLFIMIESLENQMNHAESRGYKILSSLFVHYLPNKKQSRGLTLNMGSVLENNKFELGNMVSSIGGTFVLVEDLHLMFEKDINIQRKVAHYLNKINEYCVLVVRGDKKQLEVLAELMEQQPHFKFNYAFEYDFAELAYSIENYFKQNKFALEEGWEGYLRLYLSKPSEMSRQKGYDFYDKLTEELKKRALTDVNQIRCENSFILIKNEYFGVNKEHDVENLKSLNELKKLIGMNEAKQSVEELIAYLEFNRKLQAKIGKSFPLNLHMLFTGNPGTGKTTLARIVAKILFELGYIKKDKLVEVDKKDLVSHWVGHTSIKTNEIIQQARGGVLFIDEAYSVADDKFGKDAIATLIKAMEDLKTELVVIFAGYKKEMEEFLDSNPGIRSRIGKKIHFEDYSQDELMKIYDVKFSDYNIETNESTKVLIRKIVGTIRNEENFGNGRFVDNLIQDILFQHAVNTVGCQDEKKIFTIVDSDIPEKYYPILEQVDTETYLNVV